MQLIIHRGAHQIGGNCLEVRNQDSTILVDVGLPLDFNTGATPEKHLPQPLFHNLQHGLKKIDGVLLSHAHVDHYGLAGFLPAKIPVYCGQATADLIDFTAKISRESRPLPSVLTFRPGETFRVGAFSVHPYLVDHSAFDAYAFLISAGGKYLFYTGDFRNHGRKAGTIERLLKHPPKVDVMVIEGTMLGPRADDVCHPEKDLEIKMFEAVKETPGLVLITAASQNIDRLVTIYKVARRARRRLVIDFYTAEILERLGKYAKVPQASWRDVRVCSPRRLVRWGKAQGFDKIRQRYRPYEISWPEIRNTENRTVMLIRPVFLPDIQEYLALENATWIYSMWPGYFNRGAFDDLTSYLKDKGTRIEFLHTGGHATVPDLINLVKSLQPKEVIPIHSFHPEALKRRLNNVRLVNDGELIAI